MTRPGYAAIRARIVETTSRWADGATLAEIRQGFDLLAEGDEPEPYGGITHAGMPAGWFGGRADRSDPVAILFCHGGGFQVGSLRSHGNLIGRIARSAGIPALGFEYRLAPEARFPAAHDDAYGAYLALCRDLGEGARIALAGDSAGGNLALATALRAAREGAPKPECLVLVSPWLDLATGGESYHSRAELDFFSSPEQLRAMARTYLGRTEDPAAPACSPLFDGLAGLPPLLIHAGDHDITLDDAKVLAAGAARDGVERRLRIWPGMFHHFQMFEGLPETAESIDEIGRFLSDHLRRNTDSPTG